MVEGRESRVKLAYRVQRSCGTAKEEANTLDHPP